MLTTKDRRPLTEGLKPGPEVDPKVAAEFVFQNKPEPKRAAKEIAPATATALPFAPINTAAQDALVPLTARIPMVKFQALKRASFDRQLQGIEPNTMHDIVEEALTPGCVNTDICHSRTHPTKGCDAMNNPPLTRLQEKLLDASALIRGEPPQRVDFLHTIQCQIGRATLQEPRR